MKKKEKKSWKKWQKIAMGIIGGLLALIMISAILGDSGDDTKPAKSSNVETSTDSTVNDSGNDQSSKIKTYDSGMYKIGTDMPAGEYLIIGDLNSTSYVQVATDSSGKLDSITMNDNYYNRIYVIVSDGQYLTFDGEAVAVADADPYIADGSYSSGMYKVGVDIPAGEYKISPTSDMGYYAVSGDSSGTLDSIITNNNISSDTYQTISDGQYLKLSGTEIKVAN